MALNLSGTTITKPAPSQNFNRVKDELQDAGYSKSEIESAMNEFNLLSPEDTTTVVNSAIASDERGGSATQAFLETAKKYLKLKAKAVAKDVAADLSKTISNGLKAGTAESNSTGGSNSIVKDNILKRITMLESELRSIRSIIEREL